jgi:hypothetical protein
MPAMKYLRFYLDRDCVVVPGCGKTKRVRRGCDRWTLADTQRNHDMLKGNARVVNGTGGLLIVDVDPKNGGSVKELRRRFLDLPDTRTVQTVTRFTSIGRQPVALDLLAHSRPFVLRPVYE